MFIHRSELSFSFSRSSGAGGQNVNKVNSRVTLSFDVRGSASLSDKQRLLILERLGHRINRHGVLRISSDVHRKQEANRREVIERFVTVLQRAIHVDRPRKKTRVPARERKRRLQWKKQRSRIKKLRSRKIDPE
ncbi:MAG: aminoacyl-tRNA hydrolase [Thermodesulfobacteria bacterium]|nr:aminoacyl-tRNA hydrolase [Thermodesulfobacteriota bacterium]